MNVLRAITMLPGNPVEPPMNPVRRSRRGKYLRTKCGGPTVGRKRYRAAVTLQMPDGMTIVGYSIGPARQTRLQARKLLARVRSICPYAYLWREQEIK